jgi:hypothetical protein
MDKYNAVKCTYTYLDVYIRGIVCGMLQFTVCTSVRQQRQGN